MLSSLSLKFVTSSRVARRWVYFTSIGLQSVALGLVVTQNLSYTATSYRFVLI